MPKHTIYDPSVDSKKETRDRLRAGIINSGLIWNPAAFDDIYDRQVEDLPLAVAILAATGQVPTYVARLPLTGELGLDGSIKAVWLAHGEWLPNTFTTLSELVSAVKL